MKRLFVMLMVCSALGAASVASAQRPWKAFKTGPICRPVSVTSAVPRISPSDAARKQRAERDAKRAVERESERRTKRAIEKMMKENSLEEKVEARKRMLLSSLEFRVAVQHREEENGSLVLQDMMKLMTDYLAAFKKDKAELFYFNEEINEPIMAGWKKDEKEEKDRFVTVIGLIEMYNNEEYIDTSSAASKLLSSFAELLSKPYRP